MTGPEHFAPIGWQIVADLKPEETHMPDSRPLALGQLDATVQGEGRLRLECDHCRGPVGVIKPGMSLDDLVMAYDLHQHNA